MMKIIPAYCILDFAASEVFLKKFQNVTQLYAQIY